jgi:hypothetical protein
MKTPFDELFYAADAAEGLPPGTTKAFAQAESGHIQDPALRARIASPAGAQGVMQFMPATGKRYGLMSMTDLHDPAKSIAAGAKHIKDLYTKYNGNLNLAAAAYNAGEGAVDKHKGVPPYDETKKYVPKVLSYFEQFGSPDGIKFVEPGQQQQPLGQPPAQAQVGPMQKAAPYQSGLPAMLDKLKNANQQQSTAGHATAGLAAAVPDQKYKDVTSNNQLQSLMQMILSMGGGSNGR